jgi:hypothetical protein
MAGCRARLLRGVVSRRPLGRHVGWIEVFRPGGLLVVMRIVELGVGEVRPLQVCTLEVRPLQVGALEVRPLQLGCIEHGLP